MLVLLYFYKLRNNKYLFFFNTVSIFASYQFSLWNFHFSVYSSNCGTFYVTFILLLSQVLLLILSIIPFLYYIILLMYVNTITQTKKRIERRRIQVLIIWCCIITPRGRECSTVSSMFYTKRWMNARCFNPGHLELICVHEITVEKYRYIFIYIFSYSVNQLLFACEKFLHESLFVANVSRHEPVLIVWML